MDVYILICVGGGCRGRIYFNSVLGEVVVDVYILICVGGGCRGRIYFNLCWGRLSWTYIF